MKHISCRFPLDESAMSILYLAILNNVVTHRGHQLKGCSSDIWRLADHRNRIPPRLFLDVVKKSLSSPELNGIGFQFGQQLTLAAADDVGQLIMSTQTIEQAFAYFLEYYPLLSLSMQFETVGTENRYSAEVASLFRKSEPERVQWFITESFFYSLLSSGRWLTGRPLSFKKLEIPYKEPPHGKMYETLFGCPVVFSSPRISVEVERDFMKSKVLTASYPVMLFKERQCQENLRRLKKCFSISEQIVTILKQMQPEIPSQESIAERLNLSQSSLYRKLKEADTSYQRIVDSFRREQAISYLQNTPLSICEIADKLGFSDSSNFRRAFKKWTGNTPTELRQIDTTQIS